MLKDLLINHEKTNLVFHSQNALIEYLSSKIPNSNVVVWNDYVNYKTHIQVFNSSCEEILFEASFTNLKLEEDAADLKEFEEISYLTEEEKKLWDFI